MNNDDGESLTEFEQQMFDRVQKAQELGSNLTKCYAIFGLEVRKLYEVKRRLVRNGLLPRTGSKPGKPDRPHKAERLECDSFPPALGSLRFWPEASMPRS